MRGIAGIVNFNGNPVHDESIRGLIHTMAVGPIDRIATWCDGPVGLGHLIKYIQPEDSFECQPVRSRHGGLVLITDAIIENRTELAREFGWTLSDQAALPDSRFVLQAYEKWGESCLDHLAGRFAFAVWHAHERKLFCAVDHFSLRPLYYSRRGNALAFATTLRGLLSLPDVSRRIDEGVLADFLLNSQIEGRDRTLYSDIAVLPAAHCLLADDRAVQVRRYWPPDLHGTLQLPSSQDYVDAFSGEFRQAVAVGLRVRGNIGVMLSGGLDSAAATATAGMILREQGKRLQAIHRTAPGGDPRRAPLREHDESRYVRLLQRHAPHIDFHFAPPDSGRAISLDRWNRMFDEHWVPLRAPVFDRPFDPVPSLGLDRVLNGFGGNALVSMEAVNTPYLTQLAVTLRWRRLLAEMRGQKRVYGWPLRHLFRRQVLPQLASAQSAHAQLALLPFLAPDFVRRQALPDRPARRWSDLFRAENFSVQRAARQVLTEVRPQHDGISGSVITSFPTHDSYSPFFNRRLNEFCLTLPPSAQICEGWDRRLLRRSMQGLLPPELIWRTTRGFPLPDSWNAARLLRAALPAALDEMSQSTLASSYLRLDVIRRSLVPEGYLERGRLGVFQFVSLFNVGWFLAWLERKQT